jgi:ribosomal 30S subunit maturation factor RimM
VLDDGVVWPEDAVEVGRIVDAWGVKGGIKVVPFSSDPQALFCTKKWFLRPPNRLRALCRVRLRRRVPLRMRLPSRVPWPRPVC